MTYISNCFKRVERLQISRLTGGNIHYRSRLDDDTTIHNQSAQLLWKFHFDIGVLKQSRFVWTCVAAHQKHVNMVNAITIPPLMTCTAVLAMAAQKLKASHTGLAVCYSESILHIVLVTSSRFSQTLLVEMFTIK